MRGILITILCILCMQVTFGDYAINSAFSVPGSSVMIDQFNYVHETIYVWDGVAWNPRDCVGMYVGHGWLSTCAYDLSSDLASWGSGRHYVAAYACNNVGEGVFDCNDNKWMLAPIGTTESLRSPDEIQTDLESLLGERATNFVDDSVYDVNLDLNDDDRIDAADEVLLQNIDLAPVNEFRYTVLKIDRLVHSRLNSKNGQGRYIRILDADRSGVIESNDQVNIVDALKSGRDVVLSDTQLASNIEEILKQRRTTISDTSSYNVNLDFNDDGQLNSDDEDIIRNVLTAPDTEYRAVRNKVELFLDSVEGSTWGTDEYEHLFDVDNSGTISFTDRQIILDALFKDRGVEISDQQIIDRLKDIIAGRTTSLLDRSGYDVNIDLNDDTDIDQDDQDIVQNHASAEFNRYRYTVLKIGFFIQPFFGVSQQDSRFISELDVDGTGIIDIDDYQRIMKTLRGDKDLWLTLDDFQANFKEILGEKQMAYAQSNVYDVNYDLDNNGSIDAGDEVLFDDFLYANDVNFSLVSAKITTLLTDSVSTRYGDPSYEHRFDMDNSGMTEGSEIQVLLDSIVEGRTFALGELQILDDLSDILDEAVLDFFNNSVYDQNLDFNSDSLIDQDDVTLFDNLDPDAGKEYDDVLEKYGDYLELKIGSSTGDPNYDARLDLDNSGQFEIEEYDEIIEALQRP